MSFESYQENEVATQVNEIFENNISEMTFQQRMAIVTFKLLQFIDEERLAQDEVFSDWFDRDKHARKQPRTTHIPFTRSVIEGFAGLGRAMTGCYLPGQDDSWISTEGESPVELSENTTRLEEARKQIGDAQDRLPDVYNLTPRQMKKAKKIADKLTFPNNA